MDVNCDLSLCSLGPSVQLSCAAIAKKVSKIAEVILIKSSNVGNVTLGDECSYGQQDVAGTCPEALQLIEEACIGEWDCVVDVSKVNCYGGAAELFVAVECGDVADVLTYMVWALLVIVGFGLGATIDVSDMRAVWPGHRMAFLVGIFAQVVCMPALGYFFATVLNFSDLVAVGVLIAGTCPGGSSSNLFSYFVNGNVALSIVMSGVSTLCSLFTIPLMLYLYGTLAMGLDDSFEMPYGTIIFTVALAVIPALFGMLLRYKTERNADWKKDKAKIAELVGAVLGIVFLVVVFVVGITGNQELLDATRYKELWIAAALFQPTGSLIGYLLACRFKGPERRTISLEVGIQNVTLALGIIAGSFHGCVRSQVIAFPLAAGFWWFINSVWMVALFYFLSRFDDPIPTPEQVTEQRPENHHEINPTISIHPNQGSSSIPKPNNNNQRPEAVHQTNSITMA